MKLSIGYLYPELMNIYGDRGNVLALADRAKWRGIEAVVREINVGDKLTKGEVDIFFFGGGQDQGQTDAAKDLHKKATVIKDEIERGVPLLAICGGYQLLGKYYQTLSGDKLNGIDLFDAFTVAGEERMIDNLVVETDQWGKLVGFENHSGNTYLGEQAAPLGRAVSGHGNNLTDKIEGCVYKNAIGCYMHGSLLPKNPVLADWLLKTALSVKYDQIIELENLDDRIEEAAHKKAVRRFG